MHNLLSRFEYDGKDHEVVGRPDPLLVGAPANLQEGQDQGPVPTPIATAGRR